MSDFDDQWGTDTSISMPQADKVPDAVHVDLGGFAFTPQGLVFNLTEADREGLISAPYSPESFSG